MSLKVQKPLDSILVLKIQISNKKENIQLLKQEGWVIKKLKINIIIFL